MADNTANAVLDRMMSSIPPKYNRAVGGYIHDILMPVALEFESEYSMIDANTNKLLVATAEGDDLDRLLEQFGYTRKKATFASGYIIISGAENTLVPEGTLVSKGTILYQTTEPATLIGGSATVPIRAQASGSNGNAEIDMVNYFPIMPEGVVSVTNPEKITGGTDRESDDEYRERYYYFLDHPVTSGNKYEYEQWAREVDGVGLAKCYPLWNGPGTVKVVITTAELEPADSTLISSVTEHIEECRPVGADVTVESAGIVPVSISATIYHDPSYSLTSIEERFSERISEYFKEIGFDGGVVPFSQVGAVLQAISGVEYYSALLLNGAADNNISISDGQLAVLGGVTFVSG